ncbi:MAG: class I SAM-dependent methyltransferase [Deltaproteobacteria bacterium]|nr:class I SAM-dependent methyltransferase [Deltaproteobacteria bacterium]
MAKKVSTKEIGLILAPHLLKTEDLHYGYWKGLAVNLTNLPKAQEAYTQHLISHIPQGVKTILDVGCGTGHLAQRLLAKKYRVEGVSPSPVLSDMVEKRLGKAFPLHRTTMEGLNLDRTFDLVMFSESFQYIPPQASLPMCRTLLKPGGHVLICDFFQKEGTGDSALKGGHLLKGFYDYLATQPFTVVKDLDITPHTAPNLQLVDDMLTQWGLPVWDTFGYYFKSNHPWLSALFTRMFRRKLEKVRFKYFSHQRNAKTFAQHKSYRLLLLQLKSNGDQTTADPRPKLSPAKKTTVRPGKPARKPAMKSAGKSGGKSGGKPRPR